MRLTIWSKEAGRCIALRFIRRISLTVKRIMKEHSHSIEKALEKCNKILLGMKRECENYTVYDTFGNMVFSFMRLMTLLDEFCRRLMSFRGKGCYGFLF